MSATKPDDAQPERHLPKALRAQQRRAAGCSDAVLCLLRVAVLARCNKLLRK